MSLRTDFYCYQAEVQGKRIFQQVLIPNYFMTFSQKDIVRFGAYTASGITSTKAKKTEKNNTSVKKGGGQEEDPEKLEKKPSEEISPHSQRGGEGGQVEMNKNEKKIEFHRLAVVAFPMEQHKCKKPSTATKAIARHADTNNRIYQRNLGKGKEISSFERKPLTLHCTFVICRQPSTLALLYFVVYILKRVLGVVFALMKLCKFERGRPKGFRISFNLLWQTFHFVSNKPDNSQNHSPRYNYKSKYLTFTMLHSNTLRASFWPFWRSFIDMVIRDINSFAP